MNLNEIKNMLENANISVSDEVKIIDYIFDILKTIDSAIYTLENDVSNETIEKTINILKEVNYEDTKVEF